MSETVLVAYVALPCSVLVLFTICGVGYTRLYNNVEEDGEVSIGFVVVLNGGGPPRPQPTRLN